MTDMAGYRRQNADGPNSEEKALDLFAEMMIEKIESINEDWRKPWFTEGALQWPRNLSGREYNGMNAFMLMLHCEKEGYKIPRFCTFDCVQRMNKPGKDGQELPRVSVLRGEKSFPVMLTTFTIVPTAIVKCHIMKQHSSHTNSTCSEEPGNKIDRTW